MNTYTHFNKKKKKTVNSAIKKESSRDTCKSRDKPQSYTTEGRKTYTCLGCGWEEKSVYERESLVKGMSYHWIAVIILQP